MVRFTSFIICSSKSARPFECIYPPAVAPDRHSTPNQPPKRLADGGAGVPRFAALARNRFLASSPYQGRPLIDILRNAGQGHAAMSMVSMASWSEITPM